MPQYKKKAQIEQDEETENPFIGGFVNENEALQTESEIVPELVAKPVLEATLEAVVEPPIRSSFGTETDSQLPSLAELQRYEKERHEKERERARAMDLKMEQPLGLKLEHARATGDWQIMSVPASALASIFLDEEPDTPASNAMLSQDNKNQTAANDNPAAIPSAGESEEKVESSTPPPPPPAPTGGAKKKNKRRTRH